MESRQGRCRRSKARRLERQWLPQGDTWRNVDRALPCLSARLRESLVVSERRAAAAFRDRCADDCPRQPAATLLLAHTRRILHWRCEGEGEPTRYQLGTLSPGETSLVYGGDDNVHRNRTRAGELAQLRAAHDCDDRNLQLSSRCRGARATRDDWRTVRSLHE